MIVLGVDPGTAATGYGVVSLEGSRYRCLEQGDVRSSASMVMEQRLLRIHETISRLIARHRPDAVALEDAFISKQKSPQTAVKLGQARGVILLACAQGGVAAASYNPMQVKQAVVGYGNADKQQVIYMISRLTGLAAPPKSDHAADALGLALCHLQHGHVQRLARGGASWREAGR